MFAAPPASTVGSATGPERRRPTVDAQATVTQSSVRMKAAAAFLLGIIFGVAGWATASDVSWGLWAFVAAFVAGVTLLNVHDSRFFERRTERDKKAGEAWASRTVARMLVEFEGRHPRPWSPEEVSAWCGKRLRYVSPLEVSDSRWPW